MSRFTYLVFSFLIFVGSTSAFANVFTQGTCPTGSIQTWVGSNGEVKFEGSSKLLSNKGIGYSSIKVNHSTSCGIFRCFVDPTKILPQRPNFTIPSNAVLLESLDNASVFIEGNKFKLKNSDRLNLTEGVYYTDLDIELSGSSRITISGNVTLYAHKLKAGDGKGKNWSGSVGSANDDLTLFGVGKGSGKDSSKSHIKFKGSGRVYSQIFSVDHVDIEGDVKFYGTITGKKTHLKNNAIMTSKLPANCNDNPSYSDNAKYEFGVQECDFDNYTTCNISIDESYNFAPLVFVMPTIESDNADQNAPSRLVITSKIDADSSSVTIEQKSTLVDNSSYSDVPMTSISYFIMEPGVANIDGHEVVAGFVNTNASAAKGGASSSEPVDFSSFGGTGFSESPVVLHQIQTNANSAQWTTSGNRRELIDDKLKTKLFIELSDTGNQTGISEEKIAFLAAEPSPVLNSGTSKLQFGNFIAARQSSKSAMADGCTLSLAETELDITGIIGKKQERRGPDGGWLRRCNIDRKKATFSIDEDQKKRSHMNEYVGYLAFEEVVNNIDICSYVPEGLQTNNYANGPIPWGSMAVSGRNNRIYSHSADPQYSFQSLSVSQTQDLCVYPNGQTGRCSIDSNKTHTTLPINLPRNDYGNEDYLCYGTDCEADKFKYKDVVINENSKLTLPEGIYWFNELKFAEQNAQLEVQGPTIIHYNKIYFEKDNVKINSKGKSEELLLIGHGESSYVHISEDNYEIKAFFYSDQRAKEQFSIDGNNNKIYGGITANSISISGENNHIYAADSCQIDPPSSNIHSIVVEPNNYHLTCGGTGQVYVTPYDENNQPMDDVDGESVSISAQGVVFSGGSFDSQNKRFFFDIDSRDGNQYGAIPVTANVVGTAIEDTSDLIFVPLKFEINNEEYIELIAGQQKGSIPIKALACDITGKPISLGYSVDLDESNLTQTQFIPSSGNSASLELDASVTNGEGSVSLKFDESGMFEGDLKAPILCTDFPNAQDCPENTVKEVVGKVKFKARPWKIAICDVKEASVPSNLNPATTTGNPGFMASGENFSVKYRPIIFGSGDECNLDVTTNYALDSGPLNVSFKLVYPNIVDDNLNITPAAVGPFDNSSELVVSNYVWDEVGSVQFKTSASYRAMDLNEDTEIIGRFYPKYFLQESPEWNVANQNDIAYLSQPYDSSVHQVYPMASGESGVGNALNNYRFFHSDLQAKFGVLDDTAIDNEFLLDTGAGTWSTDRKHWLLNDGAAVLKRVTDSDSVSRKDNPFNTSDANSTVTHFGLTVDGVDPVSFTDSDTLTDSVEFLVQPPARYGRIALDDIGGNSGSTLTIPLRAEFWNGDEFVPSQIDSRSTFDGSKACKQVIWHSEGAITTLASLNGSGSVDNGEEEVTANQNTPAGTGTDSPREQVRLWLRMGNSKPSKKTGENDISCSTDYQDQPWLQYNWRQLGDEDPSTVVTFGIYRGNDRVIYRGESGLTGQ